MSAAAERTIALLTYPGLTGLDLVGPLEVLSLLPKPFRAVTVGASREAAEVSGGVRLAPERTLREVPRPAVLVVPGGAEGTFRAMADPAIRDYVAGAAAGAEVVASVCTGSLVLAAAGLLDGRRATTHWAAAHLLERLGARYVGERWVEDGPFLTAAGVSAGIDMALHLAARLADEETARRIQLCLEYDPRPPAWGVEWAALGAAPRPELARACGYGGVRQTLRVARSLVRRPSLLARLLRTAR